ncbi:hypothetical protein [Lyngbya confervoides]|uniref:Uncharacterized protein n=1 Tax=Lyngbya confervoides BDU141951 TaxID=1574623 RepID=A0ABD4T4W3_9CYAN|nr:hypothetical protein [Lyngbya confervoides]MCM1983505.1 hypothetical protein [Lyngbya confervoides BDU141951]
MTPLPGPNASSLLQGLGLFAFLWVAFGAFAQAVWLQWWLIPSRLVLWLPLAASCFPWFLATGLVQQAATGRQRFLWWLGQTGALIGGLLLTVVILPQLGFVFILLPLFPLILAILSLVNRSVNLAWAYGVGAALFWGWLLAAGFPLSV